MRRSRLQDRQVEPCYGLNRGKGHGAIGEYGGGMRWLPLCLGVGEVWIRRELSHRGGLAPRVCASSHGFSDGFDLNEKMEEINSFDSRPLFEYNLCSQLKH